MRKIFTFLAVVCVTIAQAQWNADTSVNTLAATSVSADMQSLGTSEGETYIVSWKVVDAPTNFELRLQILDIDGNLKLGDDGMLISDQIPMSSFTVLWKMVVDADDNLYVSVTGTGGGDPAYVFKLDNEGNSLWDAAGINIGNGNLVTVLPMNNGDAVVSWLSSSGAVMQRYDSTGTALWAETQSITTGSGFSAPLNFHEISNGDFVAVFHDLIGGINTNLYAQRYDVDGNPVWANATQLSNKQTRFNNLYSGGELDDAVYVATSSPNGNRFDAYLQRVDADGSLPWGINGVDFDTNETANEGTVTMAIDGVTNTVFALSNYSDSTQGLHGLFIQKFDATTGARLFTDTAKEIYEIGDERVHTGQIHLIQDSPWFLIKNGLDNGASPTTLEAVFLTPEGEFFWQEETRTVASFMAGKSRIHYTQPVNGQSVAVFVEDKGEGMKTYAQNMVEESLGLATTQTNFVSFNNPVKDVLNIHSTLAINEVALYTLQGALIHQNRTQGQTATVALSTLATGVYVLQVHAEDGAIASHKIIKR